MLIILSYISGSFCMYFLEKCLFRLFVHCLNWIVCLPNVESREFFMYFGDQILVQGIIGKYIFPYSGFPFHLADVFFSSFYFDEVPFVYSFLYIPCSREHVGENIAFVEYLRFSCLCSSLRLLWCHDWYLSPLCILSLFFLWCKLVDEFHFFACSCPDVPTPFVEEAIFTPVYSSAPLVEY